jgi:hypothetical protein
MTTKTKVAWLLIAVVIGLTVLVLDVRWSNTTTKANSGDDSAQGTDVANADFDAEILHKSLQMIDQGRKNLRFDAFGSERWLYFRRASDRANTAPSATLIAYVCVPALREGNRTSLNGTIPQDCSRQGDLQTLRRRIHDYRQCADD